MKQAIYVHQIAFYEPFFRRQNVQLHRYTEGVVNDAKRILKKGQLPIHQFLTDIFDKTRAYAKRRRLVIDVKSGF